jgi:hypothetical protein
MRTERPPIKARCICSRSDTFLRGGPYSTSDKDKKKKELEINPAVTLLAHHVPAGTAFRPA